MEIAKERLEKLNELVLKHGSHEETGGELCAMEAVAWLAGEPHSDAPQCACPVITKAIQRLNDRIEDDAMRTELLRPILPKIIGSRAGRDVMVRRGFVAADMAVRVFAPIALEARGKPELAKSLREARPIVDRETALEGKKIADADALYAASAAAADAVYADAADAADAAAVYAAYAADDVYAVDADDVCGADADAARKRVYALGVELIVRMLAVT